MTISGIMSSAVSALNANGSRIGAAADNIANVSTEGYAAKEVHTTTLVTRQTSQTAYAPGGVSIVVHERGQVDMGKEFALMIQAKLAYGLNAQALKTGEQMSRNLLDVVA